MQGLGGKLGDRICSELNVQHMAELLQFTKEDLKQRYDEKYGQWLYNLARGVDLDNTVKPRLVPKSISCTKMFPRHNAITELSKLKHWLHEIAKDVVERVEEDELDNNRRPKQMVVIFSQTINNADVSCSRTVTFTAVDEEKIVNDAINVIKKNTTKFFKSDDGNSLNNPIKYLGFNVCKFESLDKQNKTIGELFAKSKKKEVQRTEERTSTTIDQNETNRNGDKKNEENPIPFSSKYQVEYRENEVVSSDDESVEENDAVANQILKMINDQMKDVQDCSSNSPISSTSSNANYAQEYAEFYKPPEVEKVNCDECGKMIAVSEVQVHADAHLAFQLNQEQHTEFQQQLKRPHVSTTPVKKRQKTDSHKKAETSSIQKYFAKGRERTPERTTSTGSSVEVEKCSECSKDIPITVLFEHMDFHAAKRLQDELMKTEMKANRPNGNVKQPNNDNKSLNKNKKPGKKAVTSKNPAVRNITTFFQSID